MPIALVIPCYNEEKRLDINEIRDFSEANLDIDLFFINDGSTDHTQEVINNLARDRNNIISHNLQLNQGKACAVRVGMLKALELKKYSYIAYWDADLATPFSEVKNFIRIIQNTPYDILIGSRVLRLGGNIKRKFKRHILGRLFATIASFILGIPVYDTQCGAKFFKASVVKDLFKEKFISYWIFDVELLFRYMNKKDNHSKIYELPLEKWTDVEGSKLAFLDFFKAPLELLKIYLKYKR